MHRGSSRQHRAAASSWEGRPVGAGNQGSRWFSADHPRVTQTSGLPPPLEGQASSPCPHLEWAG